MLALPDTGLWIPRKRRVRRASPLSLGVGVGVGFPPDVLGAGAAWTPASLSPTAWYRGDTGTVSSWTDKSGNGRHATQATGANQPSLGTAINGQATYHFSGTTQWLNLPSIPISGASTVVLIYKLAALPGTSTFTTPLCFNDGVTPTGTLLYLVNNAGYQPITIASSWSSAGTSVGISNALDTSAHSLIVQYAGGGPFTTTNYTITFGGSGVGVSASGAYNADVTSISGIGTDNSATGMEAFNGDIAEIILVNRSITGGEKTSLQTYLTARYGAI